MNNLYNSLNGQQPGKMNLIKQYNAFRQSPFDFLMMNRGINIPQEYRNNPEAAIQYLMNSGQMMQEQLDYITSVARRMGIQIQVTTLFGAQLREL